MLFLEPNLNSRTANTLVGTLSNFDHIRSFIFYNWLSGIKPPYVSGVLGTHLNNQIYKEITFKKDKSHDMDLIANH